MNLKSFTKILTCVFAALLITCCTEQTQPPPTPTSLPISTAQPDADLDDEQFSQAHQQLVVQNLQDEDVIRALSAVPRHQFVPPEYLDKAYEDHPLPIGYGQTISQPSLVALMTEILELKPGQKVLEIGTGSGYQAAILAGKCLQPSAGAWIFQCNRKTSGWILWMGRVRSIRCHHRHRSPRPSSSSIGGAVG